MTTRKKPGPPPMGERPLTQAEMNNRSRRRQKEKERRREAALRVIAEMGDDAEAMRSKAREALS